MSNQIHNIQNNLYFYLNSRHQSNQNYHYRTHNSIHINPIDHIDIKINPNNPNTNNITLQVPINSLSINCFQSINNLMMINHHLSILTYNILIFENLLCYCIWYLLVYFVKFSIFFFYFKFSLFNNSINFCNLYYV